MIFSAMGEDPNNPNPWQVFVEISKNLPIGKLIKRQVILVILLMFALGAGIVIRNVTGTVPTDNDFRVLFYFYLIAAASFVVLEITKNK